MSTTHNNFDDLVCRSNSRETLLFTRQYYLFVIHFIVNNLISTILDLVSATYQYTV